VLLGDELDSPRGRIYLIKEMLEKDRPPTQEVVKHIRSLSLLPRLHDHLSIGRALHASGRSGAGKN
jgi:Fe-S oxidoreductase